MSSTASTDAMGRLRTLRLPVIITALLTAALLIFSTGNSLATWIISQRGSGVVNTGTLSFQFANADGSNASPSNPNSTTSPDFAFDELFISAQAQLPGDTSVALMSVLNTGAAPLSLSFTGVSTSASTAAQQDYVGALSIGAVGTTEDSCTRAQVTASSPRALPGITAANPLAVIPADSALKPGEKRYLCVGLALSATAPNSAQGQSSDLTIQVRADQTR